jgi:hypothetical protein
MIKALINPASGVYKITYIGLLPPSRQEYLLILFGEKSDVDEEKRWQGYERKRKYRGENKGQRDREE